MTRAATRSNPVGMHHCTVRLMIMFGERMRIRKANINRRTTNKCSAECTEYAEYNKHFDI